MCGTGKLVKTHAIVLYSFKYSEADLILTLLGRDTGKINAIAKGARKPKSNMRGTVQQFNYGNYLLYKGKSLYTITQCETIEPFAFLRSDLSKYAYASYIVELAKEAVAEEHVDALEFYLLLAALQLAVENERLAARFFDIKLLNLAGYYPQLKHCLGCEAKISDQKEIFFYGKAGGVYCRECSTNQFSANSLFCVERSVLSLFNSFLENDFNLIKRIKINHMDYSKLETIVSRYWECILDKELKSINFIKNLRDFV